MSLCGDEPVRITRAPRNVRFVSPFLTADKITRKLSANSLSSLDWSWLMYTPEYCLLFFSLFLFVMTFFLSSDDFRVATTTPGLSLLSCVPLRSVVCNVLSRYIISAHCMIMNAMQLLYIATTHDWGAHWPSG